MEPYEAEPRPSIAKAVVTGGLIGGVLGVLPVLAGCNVCCCLWYAVSGIIAVLVYKGATETDITTGLGALLGLVSGLITGVITGTGQFFISRAQFAMLGDTESEAINGCRQAFQNDPAALEEFNSQLEIFSSMAEAEKVMWLITSMVILVVIGTIVSVLAGIITAAVAGKRRHPIEEAPPYNPEA